MFLFISKTLRALSFESILKQTTFTALSDNGYLFVINVSIQRIAL
jgi:hypothetical protein